VAVSALAENWPQAIRHELFQFNLLEAKVALPAEAIEQALQRGKITFTWKSLRSWMTSSPMPAVSPNDNQILELPLRIIAPLFLAARPDAGRRHKVNVDDSIPNLFFGGVQPEPVSTPVPPRAVPGVAPTAKSIDTNFYPVEDGGGKARLAESKADRSHGTSFVARYATPNEVVSRAASMDGVAGALIALPDGLMVASQLSPELNGDTLAAFLPQIMARVSQCTKELRMGELNNLNFTVGQVPWKIFRVNAIFFAAFGRAGEPLPTAQLAALAAELDRKPK
jgi:predicted regulator of Ras-like GTPase activity (Roadblock/LC7/MglB family)